ncbi:MAG: FAD-dependent oxidoreductase [Streptosporangiaceae bacterium]
MGGGGASGVRRRILVVGAGPVGLSAALALRARGLPVTLLEAEPADRVRPGSRAIFTHRASLETLDRARPGLGRELARQGLAWQTKRTFWRDREVYSRTYPSLDPEAIPPFTSLPQVRVEEYLLAACAAAGVECVWDAAVTGVETSAEGAVVTVSGGRVWEAEYVIGADGSRSAVREAIGTPLEGSRSANSFVIVDAAEDPDAPLPKERIFCYEHPGVGGRHVLFVPFSGGWRIDLQCREDDDPEDFSGEEGVRRWLPRVMDEKYADRVTWVSTYQFLQVIAETFTDAHRRVLLVGEAAHLFAPFGARGMNSGIADADAAAETIETALDADDPGTARRAVEEYSRSRRSAAEYNRDAAGQALAHMQAKDPALRVKRRLAALVAPYSRRAGKWLDTAPYGPRSGVSRASKY